MRGDGAGGGGAGEGAEVGAPLAPERSVVREGVVELLDDGGGHFACRRWTSASSRGI